MRENRSPNRYNAYLFVVVTFKGVYLTIYFIYLEYFVTVNQRLALITAFQLFECHHIMIDFPLLINKCCECQCAIESQPAHKQAAELARKEIDK